MTPQELYTLLDKAGVEYEVVEIFEGARILNIEVDEPTEEDEDEQIEPVSESSDDMDADIRERIYHHSMRLADNLRMIDMDTEANTMEVFGLKVSRRRVRP
jgi:hypothetical protein